MGGGNGCLSSRLQDEHSLDVVGIVIEMKLTRVVEQIEVPEWTDGDRLRYQDIGGLFLCA